MSCGDPIKEDSRKAADWDDEFSICWRAQVLFSLSLFAYFCALTLPAYGPTPDRIMSGIECLQHFTVPQWYANPLYFIAIAFGCVPRIPQWGRSAFVAAIALILGLSFPVMSTGGGVIGPGYFVWLASLVLIWLGSLTEVRHLATPHHAPQVSGPRPESPESLPASTVGTSSEPRS
jgi:hypothetical protein